MRKIQSQNTSNPAPGTQTASLAALNGDQSLRQLSQPFYACGNYGDTMVARDCLEIFSISAGLRVAIKPGYVYEWLGAATRLVAS